MTCHVLTALQLSSVPDINDNFNKIETLLNDLPNATHHLVVLPECFAFFGGRDSEAQHIAETLGAGPIQQKLSQLASLHKIWLVAGTIPVKAEDGRFFAASLVFDPKGNRVADYNKIHLFDVEVADGTKQYLESASTAPGNHISRVNTPFGELGQTVCYDLRFSGLFMQLSGCQLICVPSAFTKATGEAHWHNLLKARAIENQCYVIAANQWGTHPNKRQTYGHSVIISPWGDVEAELAEGEGMVSCEMQLDTIAEIRDKMPVQTHQRFRSNWIE